MSFYNTLIAVIQKGSATYKQRKNLRIAFCFLPVLFDCMPCRHFAYLLQRD